MDFVKVTSSLLRDFSKENVHYAVIGGFALGFWGVTRATIDMDFLLLLDDAEKADAILGNHHYQQTFSSENVARYQSSDADFGTIDIIFAFRQISKTMLDRAVEVELGDDLKIVSLQPEDLIGLKVQAIANDSARRDRDLSDINALLSARITAGEEVDWQLLKEYFDLFAFNDLFEEIKRTHDQT